MSTKIAYSVGEKLKAVMDVLSGRSSTRRVAKGLGVSRDTVSGWISKYQAGGADALEPRETNHTYSPEIKVAAVEAYLTGEGSLRDICAKYGIRSKKQLQDWIKVYNDHGEFKNRSCGSGGVYMIKGRKVELDEKEKIVKACLESGKDYTGTAEKYNVSYQQVYTWTKKYVELGKPGLEDRRGKRTADQTPRDPQEETKVRIAQLEHQVYMLQVENDLLKKVKALQRGDAPKK